MTDLLTHVLVAFVAATVLSWVAGPVTKRHVPLAMVGAVLPDTAKAYLLLGSIRPSVLGVEVSWLALQTLGGSLALAGVVTLFVDRAERRPAAALLGLGVGLHVLLDYLVVRAGGYAPPYLYPFTWAQLPAGNVYLSSDIWPGALAVAVAGVVVIVDRHLSDQ
ncbi:MAG: metal-dependent hydrolase [Haloarculaceae archaeon]